MIANKTRADGSFKKYPCECGGEHSKCYESRVKKNGDVVRYRKCILCKRKIKTIERVEKVQSEFFIKKELNNG